MKGDKKKIIGEAVIRDRNVITVPNSILKLFNAKKGDTLAFKLEDDKIILGIINREIIERETKFKIDEKAKEKIR